MTAGQNGVSERALLKVVAAIAADELQVAVRDVAVRLKDDRGLLAVDVTSPVRLPPLGDQGTLPGIIKRTRSAQAGIRARTVVLTGSQVRTVAIRITKAHILHESRVS